MKADALPGTGGSGKSPALGFCKLTSERIGRLLPRRNLHFAYSRTLQPPDHKSDYNSHADELVHAASDQDELDTHVALLYAECRAVQVAHSCWEGWSSFSS